MRVLVREWGLVAFGKGFSGVMDAVGVGRLFGSGCALFI